MSLKYRLEAYRELAKRYTSVFSHFWQIRETLGGGMFDEQEAEFLPAALSLQEKPVSATAKITGRLLIALIVMLVVWSVFGHIDIIVNATGKIVPSGRTKTIMSIDVAAVRVLRVQEGQFVHAGDVLIELDASSSDAEHDKAQSDASAAILQVARSKALIAAVDTLKAPQMPKVAGIRNDDWQAAAKQLDGQWRDFYAKVVRFDDQISEYQKNLPLVTQTANDYKVLLKDHDVSEHAWIEKEQARILLEGQLSDAKNQRKSLIAQTRKESQDTLSQSEKSSIDSRQDALKAGEHSKLLKLTTPVDGTVQQLAVHTVGAAVPAAQPLMKIVPQEKTVEVEAFLENKDIGFVHEGQIAEVKIDTFDYAKYGTIPAKVIHVSPDAIQDEKKGLIYAVKVGLDKNTIFVDGRELPLTAGMSATVEIKTGTRRVIEYVLSPLIQHQREALHER